MTESEPRRRQRRPTLTDKMVAALPKKRKRYIVRDPEQRGHYVRVMLTGPNVYCAVARDPFSKQVWHTIGSSDVLTIDHARERARTAIKRIREGVPPVEPLPAKPASFGAVAAEWLKRHVEKNGLRSRTEVERVLKKNILPHWGNKNFVDIRRSDVTALLDHVEDTSGPSAADHVLAIARGVASWFASRHDTYSSPFVRGMRRTDPKSRKRERILSDAELRAVWRAAEDTGTYGALVRLLLLTAQRRSAVTQMKWGDLDGNVWRIPMEERAKGTAGTLALPEMAMQIVDAQPRHAGTFVFAAGRGAGPLNGFSKAKAAFDRRCGVTGWTLHDLRRTARSLLSRAGVRPDIAERVLGHAIGGVAAVYDRHRYDSEKADALHRLASVIDSIVHPSNDTKVVPLVRPVAQP